MVRALALAVLAGLPPPLLAEPLQYPSIAVMTPQAGQGLAQARARAEAWARSGKAHPAAAPAIISGSVAIATVNVAKSPATPAIRIKFTAPGIFNSVSLTFQSPTGAQWYTTNYGYPPPVAKSGTIEFQSVFGPMSIFAEAGAWTLLSGTICDLNNNCTNYNATQLAALFTNGVSMTVINPGKQDLTPPVIVSGTIVTPSVSASASYPFFEVKLKVTDNLSGVGDLYITLQEPDGTPYGNNGSANSILPEPVLNGSAAGGVLLAATVPTGTWTIAMVQACDLAANCTGYNTPAQIQALLGTNTFTVTP